MLFRHEIIKHTNVHFLGWISFGVSRCTAKIIILSFIWVKSWICIFNVFLYISLGISHVTDQCWLDETHDEICFTFLIPTNQFGLTFLEWLCIGSKKIHDGKKGVVKCYLNLISLTVLFFSLSSWHQKSWTFISCYFLLFNWISCLVITVTMLTCSKHHAAYTLISCHAYITVVSFLLFISKHNIKFL